MGAGTASKLFPTKRLNPVAGTKAKYEARGYYSMFPTKRLNPVAGTGQVLVEIIGTIEPFPTKRLNPVAGTKNVDLDAMQEDMVSNKAT